MKELPLLPPNLLETESSSASTIEELIDWRVKDRLRTVAAGLILCLHLGVDPPDVCKPLPCARWECWIDPVTGNAIRKVGCDVIDDSNDEGHLTLHLKSANTSTATTGTASNEKVREAIARNLLLQYENWQPRVRYKTLLDPTVDELRKLCTSLRKSAKHERVLLHYNGHGVPRPTRNGEFWVFNKQFTQYIPVNVADVVGWLGGPTVWILDCPAAGFLSNSLQKVVTFDPVGSLSDLTSNTLETAYTTNTNYTSDTIDNQNTTSTLQLIIFSACDSHETLPFTPSLPADILTSCLTTPLDMAIRWHCHIGGPLLPQSLTVDSALQIPGKLSDRRTPLGELNWIFTAVTDTIAWLVLPRDLFRRLYRQDLLIASLSRNYLLAQRILKSLYCTASAYPPLPPTHQHSLWTLWDHALDTLLAQLQQVTLRSSLSPTIRQSTFFPDQLDAFELWLRQHRNLPATQIIGPPDQLPAALQVLLSQNLRPRALKLFAEFCDFGPWACLECLHVGIHPYILKLIGTSNSNNTNVESVTRSLLHIWTRLMSVDASVKTDLLKDSAFMYFVTVFPAEPEMAAMALTAFSLENPQGRTALLSQSQDSFKALIVDDYSKDCTLWRLLLIGLFPELLSESSNEKFGSLLSADSPEIRTAALLVLNLSDIRIREFLQLALQDPSPLVRLELAHLTCNNHSFSDIFEALKHDPFPPIATRNYSNEKSNFIAHCLNDSFNRSTPSVQIQAHESAKYQALNQLEMDSWLERPVHLRKFDSQLAVLECDTKIDKICFHPQKSQLFLLDIEGVLRRWKWETDSHHSDFHVQISPNSDFLSTRKGSHLISCSPQGIVSIYSSAFNTDDNPLIAFSCADSNVKLLEMKNGQILLAGDNKVTLYNPKTQKLQTRNRTNNNSTAAVTGLLEIDSGFILSTKTGMERYTSDYDEEIINNTVDIAHVWLLNNSFNFVTSDGAISYNADSHDSQSGPLHLDSSVTCFDHHPLVPFLFAYGTCDHSIKLCELSSDSVQQLQSIKYHDGFLGQRLGHINTLNWHPSRLILGAVTSETFVSIYGIKRE